MDARTALREEFDRLRLAVDLLAPRILAPRRCWVSRVAGFLRFLVV